MLPAAADSRVASMDVLRGIAILLILPINLMAFAIGPHAPFWYDWMGGDTLTDYIAFCVTSFFIQGKIYPILAILLGAGAWFSIRNLRERGLSPHLWCRRLAGLFVIGILHTVFIFDGDILVEYSLAAVTLLLLVGLAPRRRLWLIAAFLVLPLVWEYRQIDLWENNWTVEKSTAYHEEYDKSFTIPDPVFHYFDEGDLIGFADFSGPSRLEIWGGQLRERVVNLLIEFPNFLAAGIWQLAGWMSLGWLLSQWGAWSDPGVIRRLRPAVLVGMIIAAVGIQTIQLLDKFGIIAPHPVARIPIHFFAPLLMTPVYIALFLKFYWAVNPGGQLFASLKRAGRMTLTLYILQSAILALLFAPYALDIRLDYTTANWIATPIIWGFLWLAWESWLRFNSRGPLEALLGRRQGHGPIPSDQSAASD